MKIICIIQARMGSTRLPGKILLDLAGKPALLRLLDRALRAKTIDKIIVATTDQKKDDVVYDLVKNYNKKIGIFRGSEEDVLDRYYQCAKNENADAVVRITGDCPLIDPEIIDKVVNDFKKRGADYACNMLGEKTYPRGMDVEIASFNALEAAWNGAKGDEREHVTLYIKRNCNNFKCEGIINEKNYSQYRLTIDEELDYELVKQVYEALGSNPHFSMDDIAVFLDENPHLKEINKQVKQKNEYY